MQTASLPLDSPIPKEGGAEGGGLDLTEHLTQLFSQTHSYKLTAAPGGEPTRKPIYGPTSFMRVIAGTAANSNNQLTS